MDQKSNCYILFPVNLYKNINKIINKNDDIYLIEDPRYFIDFKYHKLKLAYHFATMEYYYNYLNELNYNCKYVKYEDISKDFYKTISNKYDNVNIIEFGDDILMKRLLSIIKNLKIIDSLNFLLTRREIIDNADLFTTSTGNRRFASFYIFQRKKLDILIESDKKGNITPIGNKWNFDSENRSKYPKDIDIDEVNNLTMEFVKKQTNKQTNEKNIDIINIKKSAINRANKEFRNNYGDCNLENFIYPITFEDSEKWLNNFLKNKFENFGIYEDAVHSDIDFGYHSVISPMMNVGLLTDTTVIKYTLKYQDKISLSSFEGFIRQVIGWRNYIWAMYVLDRKELAESNQYKQNISIDKKLYTELWTSTTNVPPIDNIIKKIIKYSYCHHIERLMFLGTYLLINNITPQDTYKMFMEWTIDAYDWVMIPNITMTSNNTNKMMTRLYINSSNYILKMSNYKRDKWADEWDEKYHNFMNKHNLNFYGKKIKE